MTPYQPPGPRQPLVVGPAIVAPLLLLFGGLLRIVDRVRGAHESASVWDLGHAMLLFAFVLFGLMVVGLGRVTGVRGIAATAARVAGTTGAALAGWACLGMLYPDAVRPSTSTVVVTGLVLLVLGAVAQLVHLVERGALPVWSPLAVVGGAGIALMDLDLLPLAGGILLIGLAPLTDLRLTAPACATLSP